MTASITVYTKDACVQCDATMRALNKLGLDYSLINMSDDPQARDTVMEMGFSQAPVVVAESDQFSGFRPDRIKKLVA